MAAEIKKASEQLREMCQDTMLSLEAEKKEKAEQCERLWAQVQKAEVKKG